MRPLCSTLLATTNSVECKAMDKDVKELVRTKREEGWQVDATRSGHLRFQKGDATVFGPSTPSDHRSIQNLKAQLRRVERNAPMPETGLAKLSHHSRKLRLYFPRELAATCDRLFVYVHPDRIEARFDKQGERKIYFSGVQAIAVLTGDFDLPDTKRTVEVPFVRQGSKVILDVTTIPTEQLSDEQYRHLIQEIENADKEEEVQQQQQVVTSYTRNDLLTAVEMLKPIAKDLGIDVTVTKDGKAKIVEEI